MSPEHSTFNQLNEQIDAGHKKMTVLVERSDGKISTGHYKGEKLHDGQYVVEVTARNGKTGYRTVQGESLSDTAQAELAETLAMDSGSRQPESADAAEDRYFESEVYEPQDERDDPGAEDHEALASAEHIAALRERSERFVRENVPLIEGMQQGERQLMDAIDQGKSTINHFKYGNITKEQAVTSLHETIDHINRLAAHQSEAIEGHLLRDARSFAEEAAETVSAVSRESQDRDIDDTIRLIVRHTEAASLEISSAVRIMDVGRDERSQALRRLSSLVDELARDSWGSETTAAQIGKVLADLEETTGYQFRGLGRIEAETDTLRRLQNK